MAELLRSFDQPITHAMGSYAARVVGRHTGDGMWEGWLEFVPLGAGKTKVVVSPAESLQPSRNHLEYWASGLTTVYAEGSLDRALNPIAVRTRTVAVPASAAPLPRIHTEPVHDLGPEPVLDPFEVGSRSPDILRQELRALNRARLLNIIAAYDLNRAMENVSWMSDAQLVTFIVVAVEAQLVLRAK